jgi:hypothetical protein
MAEDHTVDYPPLITSTITEFIQEVELLPTGLYTIRTVPSLQLVGRNIVEDASLDPKGVYGQPLGVPMSENTTFMLRHVGGLQGDSYYITVGRDRGRVVGIEGRVAAVFHDSPDVVVGLGGGFTVNEVVDPFYYDGLPLNQRWAVKRQPQHGRDVYTYVDSVCLLRLGIGLMGFG